MNTWRKVGVCLFAAVAALVSSVAHAEGASLYVATNGSDSNAGTEDAPFATLAKAVSSAGSGVTTIYMKDGTHVVDSMISLTTAGREIHIEGYSKDPKRVTLKGTSGRLIHNDGPYCELKYLTFTTGGVHINSTVILAKDGRISNCIFANCRNDINGIVFITRNAIVENCLFYGNKVKANYGQLYCIADGNTTGNPKVVNCTFVDSNGGGGVAMGWDHGSVINCVEWTGGVLAIGAQPVASCYFNCAGDFDRTGAVDWMWLQDSPFLDLAQNNYEISTASPLYAVGDVERYSSAATSETDLAGRARLVNGTISIGCYEVDGSASSRISAAVSGWYGLADDAAHACKLSIVRPIGGVGCDVSWAWSDSGEFTHETPESYVAVGTYTNVVRVTCEGYEPYQGTGVVRIVGWPVLTPDPAVKGSVNTAFNELLNNGFGGTIQLGEGTYELNAKLACNATSKITIRGLSPDPSKTVLRQTIVDRVVLNESDNGFELSNVTLTGAGGWNPNAGGAGMLIRYGRVRNCIVSGNGGFHSAVFVSGEAVLENCLICSNACSVAVELTDGTVGTHALVNCTIIGNDNCTTTIGTYQNKTDASCNIVNCAAFGGQVALNAQVIAACTSHCASDCEVAGWVHTSQEDALDASFYPQAGGPLVNAGTDRAGYLAAGAISTVDLYGKSRFAGRKLDIGCCEHSSQGLMLMLY